MKYLFYNFYDSSNLHAKIIEINHKIQCGSTNVLGLNIKIEIKNIYA